MAIVCHCEVVRERTIVKAIRRGASTMSEVQAVCGAAIRCGGCEEVVCDLLERHGKMSMSDVTVFPSTAHIQA